MQTEKIKGIDYTRKSLFREILSWIVTACSIFWLIFIWNTYARTANDKQIFFVTLLIYIPIWIVHAIVRNRGEQYKRLSNIIGALAFYPPFVLYTWYRFTSPKSVMEDVAQLILFTAFFGVFWELGKKVNEFKIVLFRD